MGTVGRFIGMALGLTCVGLAAVSAALIDLAHIATLDGAKAALLITPLLILFLATSFVTGGRR